MRHTEVQVEQSGGASMNDDGYRSNHFNSTGSTTLGTYDYAPASYGSQMRGDARYQGRQWEDVESNLRSDCESRNAGVTGSTREKIDAAVHHGTNNAAR